MIAIVCLFTRGWEGDGALLNGLHVVGGAMGAALAVDSSSTILSAYLFFNEASLFSARPVPSREGLLIPRKACSIPGRSIYSREGIFTPSLHANKRSEGVL